MKEITHINLMNFDETLVTQEMLVDFPHRWIDVHDIPSTQGYCTFDSLEEIRKRLADIDVHSITYIGNGNYHYVTYLLLEKIKEPFSLVLFDHHTDAMANDIPGVISCGSWVSYSLDHLPYLQRVVIVGARSQPLYSERVMLIAEEELMNLSMRAVQERIEQFIEGPIYVSVDKDVLYDKAAATNWDQGSMGLLQLLNLLRKLDSRIEVLGMDICGEWPTLQYPFLDKETYDKIRKNERVNRAILDSLQINNSHHSIPQ
ncbi:arginase family protein [Pullulanibacillus sp. KACC 23026]|uniref:arginase family protein n=1 Tax=Pullulanibacillus sp. KACC 23026 TaxID=3028315 RepID=UPI0023B07104|nr:arginase family protein [Pullulanibacillus sp. KACC 23026]WEG12218.1 arginase family protein [Pullulanibacillus sp. KACC 23026]